jgi:NAD(P)-dependent dehydrogenase (short-subunit alcohol dehydrogenase family)
VIGRLLQEAQQGGIGLWASAGMGEPAVLGEITEEQFHRAFWLNGRGALFTVQKALPLINDNGSIVMTGSKASLGAFPGWSLYAGSKPSSRRGPASGSTNCATARSGPTS